MEVSLCRNRTVGGLGFTGRHFGVDTPYHQVPGSKSHTFGISSRTVLAGCTETHDQSIRRRQDKSRLAWKDPVVS